MKSARELAFEVIYRTHKKGSYVNLLLRQALTKSELSPKDKSLVTELTYGVLRRQGSLDWALSLYTSKKLEHIDCKVLDILRLGAYQIIFLDKIPDYAACSESVKLAKRYSSPHSASFINAVLRKLAQEKDKLSYPEYEDDPVGYISLKYSHPRWLVEMWKDELGLEETRLLCEANNIRPHLSIRANTLKTTVSGLLDYFRENGIQARKSSLVEEGIIIKGGGDVLKLPGFNEGLFQVQDEASILVGRLVGPQPGEIILDVCAAPGGKATHLAQLMRNQGSIIAVDIHSERLKLVRECCLRLGVSIVTFLEKDATKLEGVLKEPVDRALVDAPCSGLGTLAKRPDARWQKDPERIEELVSLQLRLLKSTAKFIKSGGTLVYSVCTISKKESEGVVEEFLKENPQFDIKDISANLPDLLKNRRNKEWIQLLPHRHKTDGMFIAYFSNNRD